MKNSDNNNLKATAQKADINIDELKAAAKGGNINDFINKNLSPSAAAKLKGILTDKAACDKLLSTPQAKDLMNKLMNDKK